MRNVRFSPPPPINTGSGRCNGFGKHSAPSSRKCVPANEAGPSAHSACTTWTPSSSRSMRSRSDGKGRPKASCSGTFHPAPMPSTKRPPDSRSICAAMRASNDGWRNVMDETSGPKRMRELCSATSTNERKVSSASRLCGPEREKKWSDRQSDSNPRSSVAWMMRRQRSQFRSSCPSIMTPRSTAASPSGRGMLADRLSCGVAGRLLERDSGVPVR